MSENTDKNWSELREQLAELLQSRQERELLLDSAQRYYWPLAIKLAEQSRQIGWTLVLGVNGAQGTGKSTMAMMVETMLTAGFGLKVASFSLDDIYLTKAQRLELAETTHPLLAVRGVPGTHDVPLGLKTIQQLKSAAEQDSVPLPSFDKSQDDRAPQSDWRTHHGQCDVVIFEGWCVDALPQRCDELVEPVNALEAQQDSDGAWRHYVNRALETEYAALFGQLDLLVMLRAPSMEIIYEWRWQQEQQLIERTQGVGEGLMDRKGVEAFIQYYERITRHMLEEMPKRADWVFQLSEDHSIESVSGAADV